MEFEKKLNEINTMMRDKMAEKELIFRVHTTNESKLEGLREKYDKVAGKLWDDYELTRADAVALNYPPVTAENRAEYAKTQMECQNKLRYIGHVDLDAVNKYKEIKERYDYMSEQIKDLEKSRNELTDIIVKLLRLKFRHISTGAIFLFTDGMVCLASGFVFKDFDNALYAAIAVFIQMFVLNMVLYGSDEARMVYIISDRDEIIAKRLLEEIDAGATYLYGNGAYTGKDRKVLMCALKMRAVPQAREIIRQEDSDAFVIVTKATNVFGEGFKSHVEDDL